MIWKIQPKFTVLITFILLLGMLFIPMMTNTQAGRALVFSINVKANDDSGSSIQNAPVIAAGTPGFTLPSQLTAGWHLIRTFGWMMT